MKYQYMNWKKILEALDNLSTGHLPITLIPHTQLTHMLNRV